MAIPKFATVENGEVVLKDVGIQSSAGIADADKAVVTDATGRIDMTFLPDGIGDDAVMYTASENLGSGDLINIWDDAGTFKVRKADAAVSGKVCQGFVKSSAVANSSVKVFFDGSISGLTGITSGTYFLSDTTPGRAVNSPPTDSGSIIQKVGFGLNSTTISFEAGQSIKII
jgi:hypothetical protein